MCAHDFIEHSDLEFLAENINLVGAEESEAFRCEQLVPQSFEAVGGGRVTRVPEQVHHLSVRAHTQFGSQNLSPAPILPGEGQPREQTARFLSVSSIC